MGWKNWPSWVRGGVIGFILFIVLTLVLIIDNEISQDYCTWKSNIKTSIYDASSQLLRDGLPTVPCTTPLEEIIIISLFTISRPLMIIFDIELPFIYEISSDLSLPILFRLVSALSLVIYGIIIGFIIGKIKQRREDNN